MENVITKMSMVNDDIYVFEMHKYYACHFILALVQGHTLQGYKPYQIAVIVLKGHPCIVFTFTFWDSTSSEKKETMLTSYWETSKCRGSMLYTKLISQR